MAICKLPNGILRPAVGCWNGVPNSQVGRQQGYLPGKLGYNEYGMAVIRKALCLLDSTLNVTFINMQGLWIQSAVVASQYLPLENEHGDG